MRCRRSAARTATAEEAEKTDTGKVSSLGDKVDEEALDEQSGDTAEEVDVNVNHLEETIVEIQVTHEHAAAAGVDKEETDFNCDICDAKFNNLRGLRAHKGRMHKADTITQVDGADDTDCDMSEKCLTYTFVSDFHQEDVDYTLKEIFPGIGTKILSNVKVGDRFSADHLFSVLIDLQDDQNFSWPRMSADQAVVFKDVQKQ